MTPEEVFAQLRDIHAPSSSFRDAVAYDVRPMILFLIIVLVALALRLLWKRAEARRFLSRIDPHAPHADQRDALIRLAAERRRGKIEEPTPEAAYQPPSSLTGDSVQRLRRWVSRRIV